MKSSHFELHADMELEHWWFRARRKIMKELIHKVIAPSREATIVDVGCGTGGNIASLSSEYYCVGIDPSYDGISLAKRRFTNVHFIHGNAPVDLGEIAINADLCLLMDVLEHVRDDFKCFSELVLSLRPGAYVLLTVPADNSLWSEHDVSYGHYRRYDHKSLEILWLGLPVTNLLLSYFNSRLYPIIRLIRRWNQFRGKTIGISGTDLRVPYRPINKILENIFSAESKVLVDLLEGRCARGYSYGVSLIALLRRES